MAGNSQLGELAHHRHRAVKLGRSPSCSRAHEPTASRIEVVLSALLQPLQDLHPAPD